MAKPTQPNKTTSAAGLDGNLDALIKLAQSVPHVVEKFDEPFIALPDTMSLRSLEQYLDRPTQIRTERTFENIESLTAYVNEFKTLSTRILCSRANTRIVAELDSDKLEKPAWRYHKATLHLAFSPNWKAWADIEAKGWISQDDLATFLEENAPDLAEPSAAHMLEIVSDLQATSGCQISAVQRQGNLARLSYMETNEVRGAGSVEMPKRLKVGIPVFAQAKEVVALLSVLLRYRIQDKRVMFALKRLTPEVSVEQAIDQIESDIAARTKLEVLRGS